MPKVSVRKEQFGLLAMMIVEGWSPQDIAEGTSLPVEVVKRFAGGNGTPTFNVVLEKIREKFTRAVVQTKFDFIAMQNDSVKAIQAALRSEDKRLAAEHAWKVLDVISPQPKDGGVNVNLSLTQNNQVNQQMEVLGADLMKTFGDLKKLQPVGYERHLKTGLEGLPDPMQRTLEAEAEDAILDAEYVAEVPEGAPDIDEEQPNA